MGGFKGYYYGTRVTVIRATIVGATYMGTYQQIKEEIIRRKYAEEGLMAQFGASVASGFCVTTAQTPFDNIKTRLMVQGLNLNNQNHRGIPTHYTGLLDCAYKMMRYEGPLSYLKGFSG